MMQHRGGELRPTGIDGRRRRWTRRVWALMAVFAIWLAAAPAVAEPDEGPELAADIGEDRKSPGWTLTAGLGIQEVASRDELGSPLMYDGVGFPLLLRADVRADGWSGGARLNGFTFGLNGGELTTDQARAGNVGHRADSVFVDLSTWLQWPIATPDNHRLSVGVQLSHWTFFRSYVFDSRQLGSVETWDATLTADIRAQIERSFQRLRWRLGASLAVAGRMMRPSYGVRGDERIALIDERRRILTYGQWATIGRLQKIQADASVEWELSDRWALTAQYRAGVLVFRDDVPTRALNQQALVGGQFRF